MLAKKILKATFPGFWVPQTNCCQPLLLKPTVSPQLTLKKDIWGTQSSNPLETALTEIDLAVGHNCKPVLRPLILWNSSQVQLADLRS